MGHLRTYEGFIHNLFLPKVIKRFQKTLLNLVKSNYDNVFSQDLVTNKTHTYIFGILSDEPYNERTISIYYNLKNKEKFILFANTGKSSPELAIMQEFLEYMLEPFSFGSKHIKIKLDRLDEVIIKITQENFDLYKNSKKYNL